MTKENTILARTPAPMETESLMGYALRLSEANGYESPRPVLQLAGFSSGEMTTAGFSASKLETVLGKEPGTLNRIAYDYRADDGTRTFAILGHSLGKRLGYEPLRLSRPALCPRCIDALGFHDAFWDIRLAVACPVHASTLVSHCPTCNKPLTFFRPGLLTCKCGADLRAAHTKPVGQALADLMALLKAKLHRVPVTDDRILTRLPLAELLSTPFRSLLLKLPKLGIFAQLDAHENLMQVMESTANALSDWPNGFRQFVARFGGESSVVESRRRATRFYSTFFETKTCGSDFDWLRTEFLRCGLESELDCLNEQFEFGKAAASRWVSNAILCRQLTISPSTLIGLNDKRLVALTLEETRKRERTNSSTGQGNVNDDTEEHFLGHREAAEYIRMPVRVLSHLVRSGHLKLTHTNGIRRKRGRPQTTGLHKADLDAYLKQLLTACQETECTLSDAVSLEQVLRKYRFHDHAVKVKFVTDYLAGVITPITRTGDTLAHIMFRKIVVVAYAAASRAAAAGGALSQQEASQFIECDPQAIPKLLEKNFLDAIPGREGTRVSRSSVEDFVRQYVALNKLAVDLETTSKRLRLLCYRGAIPTLAMPRTHGAPIRFIKREDADCLTTLACQYPSRRELSAVREPKEAQFVTAARAYLARLQERKERLPRRAGVPNKSAIAKACGFPRDALYDRPAVVKLLADFDKLEIKQLGGDCLSVTGAITRYLNTLRESGAALPRWKKFRPNKKAIAKACGFHRNALHKNQQALELLEAFRN